MPKIHVRARARQDLIDHYVYLSDEADSEVANRFLANTESSFSDLALQPGMGAPLALRATELAGLRKWRVKAFENILIFYLPRRDGVSIVRVLHAARDWWKLLGY